MRHQTRLCQIIYVVIGILLVGCSGTLTESAVIATATSTSQPTATPTVTAISIPTPTPSSSPSIIGKVSPWGGEGPIANRKVALCQSLSTHIKSPVDWPVSCRLMDSTVTTDIEGKFVFYDIPPDEYLLLYDSGMMDFNQGISSWKDQTLRLGDVNWLVYKYFDVKYGIAECYIPDKILPMSIFLDMATSRNRKKLISWSVIYLHCNSPFILAQEQNQSDSLHGDFDFEKKTDVSIGELRKSSSDDFPGWNSPVIIQVAKEKVSEVSIDVMYFGDKKLIEQPSKPTDTPTITPTLPAVITE